MIVNNDNYIKFKRLTKMICPICYEASCNTNTECNHSFCTPCILKWKDNGNNKCPMCRQNLILPEVPNSTIKLRHVNYNWEVEGKLKSMFKGSFGVDAYVLEENGRKFDRNYPQIGWEQFFWKTNWFEIYK